MVELKFSRLKKEFPKEASGLLVDQELLLVFLNSPIRNRIMKFARLDKKEQSVIKEFIDYYAKLKIEEEKKRKPKTSNGVRKIEISILKRMFSGEVLEFKNLKKENVFKVASNILKIEYPNSVVLDMLETDKIATLAGIETKKEFPSGLLVFDLDNKKIIGVEVIIK